MLLPRAIVLRSLSRTASGTAVPHGTSWYCVGQCGTEVGYFGTEVGYLVLIGFFGTEVGYFGTEVGYLVLIGFSGTQVGYLGTEIGYWCTRGAGRGSRGRGPRLSRERRVCVEGRHFRRQSAGICCHLWRNCCCIWGQSGAYGGATVIYGDAAGMFRVAGVFFLSFSVAMHARLCSDASDKNGGGPQYLYCYNPEQVRLL
eukprot:3913831-Rhodomonas_salina.3